MSEPITLHELQMLDGPVIAVNPRHIAVVAPIPGGGLVGVVMLAWATPVCKPTRVRATLDDLGRTFGFVRLVALAGEPAYINPLHVAEVLTNTDDKGATIVGESLLIFASPLLVPTPVRGGVTEIRKALSESVGPALVRVSL